MIEYLAVLLTVILSYTIISKLIPHLKDSGITGRDMNKEDRPIVAEMGGISVVAAFVIAVMGVLFMNTMGIWMPVKGMDATLLIAGTLTIVLAAFIGVVDDLISLKQWQKAIIPVVASVPLIAVKAGVSTMWIPFFGVLEFGIFFYILLIPIIVTGATNATNMLAGFNGLEAGLGFVSLLGLGSVCFYEGNYEAAIIGLSTAGALLGFILKNKFPASVFPGDVGTLATGAAIAAVTILGNVHKIGLLVLCLYLLEFVLKALGGFKTQSWCRVEHGLLVCNRLDEVHGTGRLLMYLTGGISEKKLTTILIIVQSILVIIGIAVFYTT